MSQTTTPSGADVDPLAVLDARIIDRRFALSAAIGAHGMSVAAEELRKAIEARAAVAALISRNAELEAERDHEREMASEGSLIASNLRRQKERLIAERDALAADILALREVRETADRLQSKLPHAISESHYHARDELRDLRAALARTPAATTKENGND